MNAEQNITRIVCLENYQFGSNISILLFVGLESCDDTLFSFELELGRELNVKGHVEVPLLVSAFHRHALIFQKFAC